MSLLRIKQHFDAAHRLLSYDGKEKNLHGHRWEAIFEFSGQVDAKSGMIVDFAIIKKLIAGILPDHQFLNEVYSMDDPTPERIANRLYVDLLREFRAHPELDIVLERIELFESPEHSVVIE